VFCWCLWLVLVAELRIDSSSVIRSVTSVCPDLAVQLITQSIDEQIQQPPQSQHSSNDSLSVFFVTLAAFYSQCDGRFTLNLAGNKLGKPVYKHYQHNDSGCCLANLCVRVCHMLTSWWPSSELLSHCENFLLYFGDCWSSRLLQVHRSLKNLENLACPGERIRVDGKQNFYWKVCKNEKLPVKEKPTAGEETV